MKHTRQTIIELINDSKRVVERQIDLSDQDLSSLDLSSLDLSGADLQDANLHRADLREANLRGADLQGANLQRADLLEANLQEAYLRGADLQRANLRGANLRGANLDLTGYELSCRTIGIIADARLVSQLLYHLCQMNVQDCPEWDELRNDERVIALANQSHAITTHKQPVIEPLKAKEMKLIPITTYAKIDTVHCHSDCKLRAYRGNGYEWEHYCTIFDVDLEYDTHTKKWWRCENCIANEKAQEEE